MSGPAADARALGAKPLWSSGKMYRQLRLIFGAVLLVIATSCHPTPDLEDTGRAATPAETADLVGRANTLLAAARAHDSSRVRELMVPHIGWATVMTFVRAAGPADTLRLKQPIVIYGNGSRVAAPFAMMWDPCHGGGPDNAHARLLVEFRRVQGEWRVVSGDSGIC
jgi:hypothetical protein